MKKHLALLFALLALFAAATASFAADYPTKQITMIVPYGAGGTTDIIGRQFAVALEKQIGQPIVVVNQPGASSSVGAQSCLDADPDGYTILLSAEAIGTMRVMGISTMSYDDFSPIASIASDPKVVVVAAGSKYKTMQDLLDDIKANPGKIQMSYTGPGGSGHIQALILNKFGYQPALTAYNSGAEGITAVLGDQVQFTNSNYSTVKNYLASGHLRLLCVCSTQPLAAHPDAVALSAVVPGSEALIDMPYSPLTLLVRKEVPADVQKTLRDATLKAVKDEDFNKFLDDNCVDKLFEKYPTLDDVNKFLRSWESNVSWMLYDAGAAVNSPEEYKIPRP